MDSMEEVGDVDYVVTADMLIHDDVDDERTIDEEEDDTEDGAGYQNELEDLQKEQDIPLEQLLASYYNTSSAVDDNTETNEFIKKEEHQVPLPSPPPLIKAITESPSPVHVPPDLLLPPGLLDDNDKEDNAQDQPCCSSSLSTSSNEPVKTAGVKRRLPYYRAGADPEALARLRPVPERLSLKLHEDTDNRMINSTFNRWLHVDNNSSSDEEYVDDWRREIKVGHDHQATVPSLALSGSYCTATNDVLLWSPNGVSESKVKNYLIKVNTFLQEKEGLPCGSNERDNEHALFTLQSCDYDTNKAETIFCSEIPTGCGNIPWTNEECKKFEAGIRITGKNFHALQKQVPTRSVKELIEFYYLWKKSERYDLFIQQYGRMGKKKLTVTPGCLTDFMDEYLEPSRSAFPDIHYGMTTLSAEIKKEKYSASIHHQQHSVDDRLDHTHHNKTITTRTS